MEEATVVIVGAGPSGLALGALLGRMNTKVCAFLFILIYPRVCTNNSRSSSLSAIQKCAKTRAG